ncbi:hypothetical protein Tco_1255390 [Tanacetum coccineum]
MAATTIIASPPQPHHQGAFRFTNTTRGALVLVLTAPTRVRWVLGQQPQGWVGLKTRPTRVFGWLRDSHKGALGCGLHRQECIWFCSQPVRFGFLINTKKGAFGLGLATRFIVRVRLGEQFSTKGAFGCVKEIKGCLVGCVTATSSANRATYNQYIVNVLHNGLLLRSSGTLSILLGSFIPISDDEFEHRSHNSSRSNAS